MVKAEKAQEVTMDPAALELLALAEEKQIPFLGSSPNGLIRHGPCKQILQQRPSSP